MKGQQRLPLALTPHFSNNHAVDTWGMVVIDMLRRGSIAWTSQRILCNGWLHSGSWASLGGGGGG